jgi:Rrf2 family transcriptional regulator, iron-sulfur cluster assembly transcription factor
MTWIIKNIMMFSKACEYGIKAMIYIAIQSQQGKRVKTGEISQKIGTPEAFTAKILGELVKHEVVVSMKGPYGGFYLDPARVDKIKVNQIVNAIDGDGVYKRCGLGLNACNAKQPCPMHDKFVVIRSQLKAMLESTSLQDLAEGLESGKTILMR